MFAYLKSLKSKSTYNLAKYISSPDMMDLTKFIDVKKNKRLNTTKCEL